MAKSLNELATEIFNECLADGEPVTEEQALEMARQELGAKEIKNYTQATVEKKKVKREVKLDDTKVHIVKMLKTLLEGMSVTDNITEVAIANPQKEITFKIGKDEYSISLIKHRPPK